MPDQRVRSWNMPFPATEIYLELFGEESDRVLQPCRVVEGTNSQIIVVPGPGATLPAVGWELLIYYHQRFEFVKQSARIDEMFQATDPEDSPAETHIRLELFGDCVSADGRQSYRVWCLLAGVTATFGGVKNCQVIDVSSTGFAVVSQDTYRVGEIVEATPRYRGLECTGRVSVQAVIPLKSGKFRYGVQCVDRKLQASLQEISMQLQRQKMRRLACRD
jgi:hypothetical protein